MIFFCAGAFIKKNEKSFIRDYYSKGTYILTFLYQKLKIICITNLQFFFFFFELIWSWKFEKNFSHFFFETQHNFRSSYHCKSQKINGTTSLEWQTCKPMWNAIRVGGFDKQHFRISMFLVVSCMWIIVQKNEYIPRIFRNNCK